ncbi:GvpL/GvpF family gas vesicle protein [Streptomyces lacrimifluminis]|uniref:GvpL/GvpF family gas vesicle protein n=1 Tax=Streptomyces lacrimifluminis TaxID=1500077 RepID=UPI00166F2A2E|nr:GvpL/GvpF family gas vesicle protein [Streptomyces lacrimifluminis]
MGTYVYGITAADHPELRSIAKELRGVGDPPRSVRVLTEGALAAIVSDAPEELRPRREDLFAHQQVLEEAGAAGCVLPMPFGSVAPDDDAATSVLAERAEHYTERLEALDGTVEYMVEVSHEEEAVLHRVLAENPELRARTEANRLAGGGSYEDRVSLGEMVVAAARAREAEDAVEVRQTLEPSAMAVSAGAEQAGGPVGVSFLVARDSMEAFLGVAEQLRKARPYLDVRIQGPLPPYSFVEPGPAEPAGSPTDTDKRTV